VRWFRQRWALAGALLVLAAFVAGFVADFHHTDDGCKVEIHCIACQNAMVLSTGLRAPVPAVASAAEPVACVALEEPARLVLVDGPATPSRGPPLV
jgi:hypothetical protein